MLFALHCVSWLAGLAGVIALGIRLERWEDAWRPGPDAGRARRGAVKYGGRAVLLALFIGLLAISPISCTKSSSDCVPQYDAQGAHADCG